MNQLTTINESTTLHLPPSKFIPKDNSSSKRRARIVASVMAVKATHNSNPNKRSYHTASKKRRSSLRNSTHHTLNFLAKQSWNQMNSHKKTWVILSVFLSHLLAKNLLLALPQGQSISKTCLLKHSNHHSQLKLQRQKKSVCNSNNQHNGIKPLLKRSKLGSYFSKNGRIAESKRQLFSLVYVEVLVRI
jgi:hypothetical protein